MISDTLTPRTIHQRMFGEVWTWAGSVRRRETSIGIDPSQIQTQFQQLVQNFRWRAANADEIGFSEEERRELGIRFHTEMVAIHVFVNGDGRHARLVANLVDSAMGFGSLADPLYPWGARSGLRSAESRKLYLDAIKLAGSRGEYGPLLDIATSQPAVGVPLWAAAAASRTVRSASVTSFFSLRGHDEIPSSGDQATVISPESSA